MGWDAWASVNVHTREWIATYDGARRELVVHHASADAFVAAAEKVRTLTGNVDGFLHAGGLDVSLCGKFLSVATGRDVYGDSWPQDLVKQLSAAAMWPTDVGTMDRWALESAREFLRVCAEYNLGVVFSW